MKPEKCGEMAAAAKMATKPFSRIRVLGMSLQGQKALQGRRGHLAIRDATATRVYPGTRVATGPRGSQELTAQQVPPDCLAPRGSKEIWDPRANLALRGQWVPKDREVNKGGALGNWAARGHPGCLVDLWNI